MLIVPEIVPPSAAWSAGTCSSMAPALAAMRRINALSDGPEGGAGLPYPFLGFGPNSNSFFATMLHAMGFDQPLFAQSARLVPGARKLLLPQDVLTAIRTGH